MVTHFFKIRFATKNFLAKFLIKMHRFRLIHQKLNSNGLFRTPNGYALVQNSFPTINFLAKLFINVHRFRRIHQKLNSKGFFRT